MSCSRDLAVLTFAFDSDAPRLEPGARTVKRPSRARGARALDRQRGAAGLAGALGARRDPVLAGAIRQPATDRERAAGSRRRAAPMERGPAVALDGHVPCHAVAVLVDLEL